MPGTRQPAGWGKLGISCEVGVVQASLKQLSAGQAGKKRESDRMTLSLFHLDWLALAAGLGREQSWWGVGLSPCAGQVSKGGLSSRVTLHGRIIREHQLPAASE